MLAVGTLQVHDAAVVAVGRAAAALGLFREDVALDEVFGGHLGGAKKVLGQGACAALFVPRWQTPEDPSRCESVRIGAEREQRLDLARRVIQQRASHSDGHGCLRKPLASD
jgi:hypothetical protein